MNITGNIIASAISKNALGTEENRRQKVKDILKLVVLVILGTVIMTYAVIDHEPPAFVAYVFGIITGICWAGIVFLYWLRSDDEDEGDKHD